MSQTPGKTANGGTGDVSRDHYHRCPQSVKLMQPRGINTKGLDFYDRLINALLGLIGRRTKHPAQGKTRLGWTPAVDRYH